VSTYLWVDTSGSIGQAALDDGVWSAAVAAFASASIRGLQIFEMELQLLQLHNDLLALLAEEHVPHLVNQQLQVFNPLSAARGPHRVQP
jgi:hypothetical protein